MAADLFTLAGPARYVEEIRKSRFLTLAAPVASPEAAFLKNKFVWANWDVDELKARADEIKNSSLLTVALNGLDL